MTETARSAAVTEKRPAGSDYPDKLAYSVFVLTALGAVGFFVAILILVLV